MDFLGPSYIDLINRLSTLDDENAANILDQLIECEPRANIDLYPSEVNVVRELAPVSGILPGNPKDDTTVAKEEEEPKDKSSRAQSASDIDMDTGSANSESEPVSKGPSSPVEPRPEQQDTVISKEVQKDPEASSSSTNALETYFALYIWSFLSKGQYLDAAAIVKRYRDSFLFSSPQDTIITISARAAALFSNAYPATLARFAGSTKPDIKGKKAENLGTINSIRAIGLVPNYSLIYSFNDAFPWAEPSKGGHPILHQLVALSLEKFQAQTYNRIITSFEAIRLSTLRYYLAVPDSWTAGETITFFEERLKESGKWTVKPPKTLEDGKGADDENVILIPPRLQQGKKLNTSKKSKDSVDESLQSLIKAATHLEQQLPGLTTSK